MKRRANKILAIVQIFIILMPSLIVFANDEIEKDTEKMSYEYYNEETSEWEMTSAQINLDEDGKNVIYKIRR